MWCSLPCNCEPALKECQGRVAVSGSCTSAACPCLESIQSIRHWLREKAGSPHRVLPRSWTGSRAPDSLSQSLSRSGVDPNVLEATGSGRKKQQTETAYTDLPGSDPTRRIFPNLPGRGAKQDETAQQLTAPCSFALRPAQRQLLFYQDNSRSPLNLVNYPHDAATLFFLRTGPFGFAWFLFCDTRSGWTTSSLKYSQPQRRRLNRTFR